MFFIQTSVFIAIVDQIGNSHTNKPLNFFEIVL